MKRILVTGGAGFIGSHLCESLLQDEGVHVTCWDNLSTGSEANVDVLLSIDEKRAFGNRFRFQQLDVRCCDHFRERFDEIYHLACPASPVHYQKDPVGTILTATLGTANILQLAHRVKAKFLLASTSEVYGSPTEWEPQDERDWGNVNPIGPRSCYTEGKRAAEAMAMAYSRQYGLEIKIARIFNSYGPRMTRDDGRVIPNFIDAALSNEPIRIHGKGNQTRSFCYVDDTVRGLRTLMNSEYREPVNIGSTEERKILDVALGIKMWTESTSIIQHIEKRKEDPIARCPSTSKARALGWRPQVTFVDGINLTIESRKP